MSEYVRDGDAMTQAHDGELTFRASALRAGQGGQKKAGVTISLRGAPLWSHDFTIANGKEQQWLSNAAYKQADGGLTLTKEELAHLTMLFCDGLADAFAGDATAVVTVGDLEPSRAEFLIQDIVLRDGGTILFAPPGRGKSYTGMLLAQSLNYGSSRLFDVSPDATPFGTAALYLNLERSERSMQRRLGQVNEALKLPRDTGMLMIHARGGSLENTLDGATRTIRDQGCCFVVLDSLSRAGAGDLTQNVFANAAMDMLNGLGIAWLALAHTPREDESHAYGSQMFDAAADLAIRMYTEVNNVRSEAGSTGAMGVVLRVTKTNDTGYPDPRLLVYEFNEFGLREAYVPGSAAGFAQLMEKARS